MTGTRPARDTRFGSSNDACVFAGSCDNRTCEVSSPARVSGSFSNSHCPSSEGTFRVDTPIQPYLRGGLRLGQLPALRAALGSVDPVRAAITALIAYHGLRTPRHRIRHLQLTDVDGPRLRIDGRTVLLASLARARAL